MWIVFSRPAQGAGFVSIVAKDAAGKPSGPEPTAIVSARFRRPQDAAKLFPDAAYVATPGGDYAGRVFITRQEAAQTLATLMLEYTATNFKSSIPHDDAPLHDAAMRCWTELGKLQAGGPYGDRLPARKSSLYDGYGGYAGGGDLFDYPSAYAPKYAAPDYSKTGTGLGGTGKRKKRKHGKGKAAGAGKVVRLDPFCDGCGHRFGAMNLAAGLCADCAEHLAELAQDAAE